MGLLELMKAGGFVMYPLSLCSLLIWAVVFEKCWMLFQFKREYLVLHDKAKALLQERRRNEARGLFINANKLVAAPHLILFDSDGGVPKMRRDQLYRRLSESDQGLKRFLWILGTIATTAPFVGLLGTVVGVIKSFDSIAIAGKGGFSVVASGLSEALIATAAGILVAIIAGIFYNMFLTRLGSLRLDFRNKLIDLEDIIVGSEIPVGKGAQHDGLSKSK